MAARKIAAAVLPHEWIFNAFLIVTGTRLLIDAPARIWAAVFFGCLAASVCMILWTQRNPTPDRWRIRLAFCYVSMGICFFSMGIAVPLMGTARVDALLLNWDRELFGETPAVLWEPFLRPWLENIAMAGYLFFFYYLLAGPGHYCFRDIPTFRKCIIGLFTIYGIALMSYTLLPAGGPHLFMTFNTALRGPLLLDSTIGLVNRGSNAVDVFPSVHVAASLYLLLFDWQHWRRRFWWVLGPCMVLWLSTLYLRFHYFVDIIAGAVLALVGLWTAQRYARAGDRHAA